MVSINKKVPVTFAEMSEIEISEMSAFGHAHIARAEIRFAQFQLISTEYGRGPTASADTLMTRWRTSGKVRLVAGAAARFGIAGMASEDPRARVTIARAARTASAAFPARRA